MRKKYGIALKEKEFVSGLNESEVMELLSKLDGNEVFPIELEAREQECSAMGFITTKAANVLDYNYESSGLHDFIALILDDVNKETTSCEYKFAGVDIWLSR